MTRLFFFRFPLGLCVVTCISSNWETGPLLVFSLLSLCCFPDSAFRLILGFPNRSSNYRKKVFTQYIDKVYIRVYMVFF